MKEKIERITLNDSNYKKDVKGCVVVPAYNEEKHIGWVVNHIKAIGMDIVVVDDGSTDNTSSVAKSRGARVIRHGHNKGKGFALQTAFKNIDTDYVVLIDADMQYHPSEIPYLVDALEDADYVIGQRDWSKVPFRHRLGNRVWLKAFNWKYGKDFKDISCGFVAMKKKVYKNLKATGGYIIEADMIIQAGRMGVKIKNVPVRVRYDNKSGILRGVRMVIGILMFILR